MSRINDVFVEENFKLSEFQCKGTNCCGHSVKTHPELLELVQKIRDHYGRAVTINSGYRCPKHNKDVGGVPDSQHVKGTAADIVVSGISPSIVYEYCEKIGVDGLGRYNTFTHVDVRGYRSRW